MNANIKIKTNDGQSAEIDLLALFNDDWRGLYSLTEYIKSEYLIPEIEVLDWYDVPEFCQDFDLIEEFFRELDAESSIIFCGFGIMEAAIKLNYDLNGIAEVFVGHFHHRDEFSAFSMNIDPDLYPFIDWSKLNVSLMQEYKEYNGFYFVA